MRCRDLYPLACAAMLLGSVPASAAVDYAHDIQPLFEKHCYECHGPKKQKNGFRLDRRSRAFAGVIRHNIIPGSSVTSRVYRRIVDAQFGVQMPLEDTLSDQEIETVRQWIDEGAHWPDALANEVDAPPPDPAALALIKQLRRARDDAQQRQAARESITREPRLINARGTDGATPLMYAALYADADTLRAMLEAGGNPNIASDSGATALMWAVEDIAKVRLLLDAGANVNATSGFGRTPLSLAAFFPAGDATTELLLARGATPNAMALALAARGSEPTVRRLLAAGAADKGEAADAALRAGCVACLEALMPDRSKAMKRGLVAVLPPSAAGDPVLMRTALERGADVHVLDAKGRSVLMQLAISEMVTPELAQTLIDRGADVQAKSIEGLSALDYAQRLGRQPIIDVLTRAGATSTLAPPTHPEPVANNTVRAAVERTLPLLQHSSQVFYDRSGCVGCHHNLQTAVTLKDARRAGFVVDEGLALNERSTLARDIDVTREQALEGIIAPGGLATATGYILFALDAQDYPADESTDSLVRLLRLLQREDGRWASPTRPPIESSEITATAVSIRGLRTYGVDDHAANAARIARATHWLEAVVPANNEDRAFRLFGLVWADGSASARQAALRELLKTQRRDGGWAQTDFRASDAYATGQSLMALHEAGYATSSRAYRRGVRYLLSTQLPDGSWLVHTRTLATQVYFESGFPHGVDQFISAAATNWATQALLQSLPDARRSTLAGQWGGNSGSIAAAHSRTSWRADLTAH